MQAPHAVRRTCDTQLDAAGWEASVNDAVLDARKELAAAEIAWAQVAGVGVKHMSRSGSEWAGRRYRTLLHVVANWIASGNAADSLNVLDGCEVALVTGNGRQNSTVSVSENVAVSSSGGNGVGIVQKTVGG
jgi:hypothetical protein